MYIYMYAYAIKASKLLSIESDLLITVSIHPWPSGRVLMLLDKILCETPAQGSCSQEAKVQWEYCAIQTYLAINTVHLLGEDK